MEENTGGQRACDVTNAPSLPLVSPDGHQESLSRRVSLTGQRCRSGIPRRPSIADQDFPSILDSNQELIQRVLKQYQALAEETETARLSHSSLGPPETEMPGTAQSTQAVVSAPMCTSKGSERITIKEPAASDVLLGRTVIRFHAGNLTMRKLCDEALPQYDAASKEEKVHMAWNIVFQIQSEGGRFLRYDKQTSTWSQASNEQAHSKVAHTIRDARKRVGGR